MVGRFVGAPSSEKAADWELKAAGSCELFLYKPSEAPYVPLHANLWLSEERWRGAAVRAPRVVIGLLGRRRRGVGPPRLGAVGVLGGQHELLARVYRLSFRCHAT